METSPQGCGGKQWRQRNFMPDNLVFSDSSEKTQSLHSGFSDAILKTTRQRKKQGVPISSGSTQGGLAPARSQQGAPLHASSNKGNLTSTFILSDASVFRCNTEDFREVEKSGGRKKHTWAYLESTMSSTVVCSGPLPVRKSDEMVSRLASLNGWLSKWCPHIEFIDNWLYAHLHYFLNFSRECLIEENWHWLVSSGFWIGCSNASLSMRGRSRSSAE